MKEPAEAERILTELLADRPEEIVEQAFAARTAILRAAPDSSELIYKTYAVSVAFSLTGKLGQVFCHVAVYAGHVNLGFNRGAELADPDDVLEGTGKLIWHVRLNAPADLKTKAVVDLIEQAADQRREMAEAKGGIAAYRVEFSGKKK